MYSRVFNHIKPFHLYTSEWLMYFVSHVHRDGPWLGAVQWSPGCGSRGGQTEHWDGPGNNDLDEETGSVPTRAHRHRWVHWSPWLWGYLQQFTKHNSTNTTIAEKVHTILFIFVPVPDDGSTVGRAFQGGTSPLLAKHITPVHSLSLSNAPKVTHRWIQMTDWLFEFIICNFSFVSHQKIPKQRQYFSSLNAKKKKKKKNRNRPGKGQFVQSSVWVREKNSDLIVLKLQYICPLKGSRLMDHYEH